MRVTWWSHTDEEWTALFDPATLEDLASEEKPDSEGWKRLHEAGRVCLFQGFGYGDSAIAFLWDEELRPDERRFGALVFRSRLQVVSGALKWGETAKWGAAPHDVMRVLPGHYQVEVWTIGYPDAWFEAKLAARLATANEVWPAPGARANYAALACAAVAVAFVLNAYGPKAPGYLVVALGLVGAIFWFHRRSNQQKREAGVIALERALRMGFPNWVARLRRLE